MKGTVSGRMLALFMVSIVGLTSTIWIVGSDGLVIMPLGLILSDSVIIRVMNPLTDEGNFTFYAPPNNEGRRFKASVYVFNVTDLYAYQVQLTINDTLLSITYAWIPRFDSQWVFYGKDTSKCCAAVYSDLDADGSTETVLIGNSIFDSDSFTGSGLLTEIEFEIIYSPIEGGVSCALDIDDSDNFLLEMSLSEIPASKINGHYENKPPMLGDITGPGGWPDGKCDIRDVALIASKFGATYPDPRYDPNCDRTGPTTGVPDGKIDIRDVALVAAHFGDIDT